MLRHPTVGDIRLLNDGREPADQYPFKIDTSESVTPQRSLGLHSRVEQSAASCPFCRAVVEIHKQQPHVLDSLRAAGVSDPLCVAAITYSGHVLAPDGVAWRGVNAEEVYSFFLRRLTLEFRPLEEGEVVQPGALLNKAAVSWQRLSGCFQPYQKEDMAADGWSVPEEREDRVLFVGRKRPLMLDPKLPALWLQDCLENHGGSCGLARNNDSEPAQPSRGMK
jgi:hypothetical protein